MLTTTFAPPGHSTLGGCGRSPRSPARDRSRGGSGSAWRLLSSCRVAREAGARHARTALERPPDRTTRRMPLARVAGHRYPQDSVDKLPEAGIVPGDGEAHALGNTKAGGLHDEYRGVAGVGRLVR